MLLAGALGRRGDDESAISDDAEFEDIDEKSGWLEIADSLLLISLLKLESSSSEDGNSASGAVIKEYERVLDVALLLGADEPVTSERAASEREKQETIDGLFIGTVDAWVGTVRMFARGGAEKLLLADVPVDSCFSRLVIVSNCDSTDELLTCKKTTTREHD